MKRSLVAWKGRTERNAPESFPIGWCSSLVSQTGPISDWGTGLSVEWSSVFFRRKSAWKQWLSLSFCIIFWGKVVAGSRCFVADVEKGCFVVAHAVFNHCFRADRHRFRWLGACKLWIEYRFRQLSWCVLRVASLPERRYLCRESVGSAQVLFGGSSRLFSTGVNGIIVLDSKDPLVWTEWLGCSKR